MSRGIAFVALFALSLAASCNLTTREFTCSADNECPAADGTYGMCVEQHCAFRNQACESGWVYDETAGSVASTCVPEAALTVDGGPDAPDASPVGDAAAPSPDAAAGADAAASPDAGPADAGPPDA